MLCGTVAVTAGCALLAGVLAALMHISVLDAYLATTPGGINAVLATGAATHSDLALVSPCRQSIRLFVVGLLAPPLVRVATRRNTREEARPPAREDDRTPVAA